MNNEIETTKNDIIESFKGLSLEDKRKALGEDIVELSTLTRKLLSDIAGPVPPVTADEYINLFNPKLTEEEYLNGLYEDFFNFREILAMYLDRITEMYYVEDNTDNS